MSYQKAYESLFPQSSSSIGISNASELQGTTLASNVINSSLSSLGVQMSNLDMGSNSINNTKSVYSDCIKIGMYRPSYSLPNLFGIYDFSDPTNLGLDTSGNKRDIIVTNSPVYTSVAGSVKNAVYFNQTTDNGDYNQYLDYSSLLPALKTNNNITVSFWVYPSATSTNYRELISISSGSANTSYIKLGITTADTLICQVFYDGSVVYSGIDLIGLTMASWNHIVFSIGTSGASCYINNVQTFSTATSINFQQAGFDTFFVGSYKINNVISNPLINSYIHTISFWSKVLSSTEITSLYNNNYDYRVVILAGQSNMRGSAPIDDVDTNTTLISGRVYEYPMSNINTTTNVISSSAIIQAQHPLTFYTGKYYPTTGVASTSLWKTFSESLLNFLPARTKIILLPIAKSGSNINEWVSSNVVNSGLVYETMKVCYNDILAKYPNSKLSAFLWHQGETNSSDSKYGWYLNTLYNNLVTDIGMSSSIPFICGEIYPSPGSGKWMINAILKSFSDERNGKYMVECSTFNIYTGDGENVHFDTLGLRQIGYLYAEKWMRHYTENYIDRNIYIKAIPMIKYSAATNLSSGSYVQTIYNSGAISFNPTNNVPVYMNCNITITPGIWLVSYCLSVGCTPAATTYTFLSTSSNFETNATTIKNNKLTDSQCQAKHTYTAGQDYRTVHMSLIVLAATSTTYYLWGMANTGTTTGYYLFNPATSGTTPDPDNSIIMNAVYLKAL